jgi:hypothetical protein
MIESSSPEIEIRIEPRGGRGTGFAATSNKQAEQIKDALPLLGKALKEPIDNLFAALATGMRYPPHEIELEIGLAFEGGANWAVVSVGAEATVALKLKFRPAHALQGQQDE